MNLHGPLSLSQIPRAVDIGFELVELPIWATKLRLSLAQVFTTIVDRPLGRIHKGKKFLPTASGKTPFTTYNTVRR